MKNKLTFTVMVIVAAIISGFTANAQTAPWRLAGNANATVNSILGTTNAIPVRLTTNNATRMYINATTGNVGIGTGDVASASYRLQVTGAAYGIYGSGSTYGIVGGGGTYGVYGSGTSYGLFGSGATGVYGSGTSYGVYGTSSASYGVFGTSSSSYGVYGNSGYLGVYGVGTTYGTYGSGGTYGAYGYSSSNYGVYGNSGYIGVYGAGTTYGLYGYSSAGNGVRGYSTDSYGGSFTSYNSYGIRAGTTNGFYAGVFDGNVWTSGTYYTSDKNLKKNIKEFGNAMSIINQLKPKNYEYRTEDKFASLNLPKGTHYGLIAQELEEVLPNLVKESPRELSTETQAIKPNSTDGKEPNAANEVATAKIGTEKKEIMNIKAVNYDELIPIIIKGMQEQDAKIQALTQLVSQLQGGTTSTGSQNTDAAIATNLSSASLDQNIPNPLNNSTSIRYNIPAGSSKAQLIVTDNNGNTVKQIQLNGNGNGVVNVETSRLSAGTYSYTLIIDGKTIETKKMVIAR